MSDKVQEILDQIKNLGDTKVPVEKMDELKEAIANREKEVDQKFGTMQDNLEKAMADLCGKIGDSFPQSKKSDEDEKPRFKDSGEFYQAVKENDVKIKDLAVAAGNTGGYLVPEGYQTTLKKIALEKSIFMPRATFIPGENLVENVPSIDPSSNADGSQYGGVTIYFDSEAAAITASNPTFDNVKLELNRVTAHSLESHMMGKFSSVNRSQYMDKLFGEAKAFKCDASFWNGDGVGKPLGVMQAPARVTVTRTSASLVKYVDVVNMIARFRGDLSNAMFVANQSCLPSIYKFEDANGNYIWHAGMSGSVGSKAMGTILGIPLIITEKCEAVGTEGDFALVDMSHYLYSETKNMEMAYSDHFKFNTGQKAFRLISYLDGQPWLKSAITPYKGGSTLSPFVLIG